ncbi:unnamed protein product [Heterobilharzia americana]|nr:unnamed protein product [Heterobilharzia americana]
MDVGGSHLKTYTFSMELSCGGCAQAAKKVLMSLGVETSVQNNTVTVETSLPADNILRKLEETKKGHFNKLLNRIRCVFNVK